MSNLAFNDGSDLRLKAHVQHAVGLRKQLMLEETSKTLRSPILSDPLESATKSRVLETGTRNHFALAP